MYLVMEIFSQYDLHNVFKIFTDGKKVIDGNSHNKITKLRHVPCFCDVCLFSHSNETIQPFIILTFQRPKVAFHKLLV